MAGRACGRFGLLTALLVGIAVVPAAALAQPQQIEVFDPEECGKEPLISESDFDEFRRQERSFRDALKSGSLSKGELDALAAGADHYVFGLTLEDKRNEMTREIPDVVRSMNLFGTPNAKAALNEMFVERLVEVLRQCSFSERLAAMVFLEQLEARPYDNKSKTPPEPYWQAGPVMVAVLENPKEKAAIKVRAARGLGRIFANGDPPRPEYDRMMRRTVAALNGMLDGTLPVVGAANNESALYVPILDALGNLDTPVTLNLQPIAVETMVRILNDPKQTDIVRATAALSLSRTPLAQESTFDIQPIVEAEMRFLRDLAKRYNENPKVWSHRWAVAYVTLSFVPPNQTGIADGDGWVEMTKTPTFRGASDFINSAYEVVRPITQTVMANRPLEPATIPDDQIAAIDNWLADHQSDGTVHKDIPKLAFQPASPDGN